MQTSFSVLPTLPARARPGAATAFVTAAAAGTVHSSRVGRGRTQSARFFRPGHLAELAYQHGQS